MRNEKNEKERQGEKRKNKERQEETRKKRRDVGYST